MSNRSNTISQINSGSDILARYTVEANDKSLCSFNKAVYRVTSSAGGGVTTFSNVIPLRSPCCYLLYMRLVGLSSTNQIVNILQCVQVNLVAGVVQQQTGNLFTSQSVAGNTVTVAKNASSNNLDVTVTITLTGVTTYSLEIEVQNSTSF